MHPEVKSAPTPPQISTIHFEGAEIRYETAEPMARWRVETLFEKEPDTIEWLRQMKPGQVFLDIGANVGMYTILAAKAKHLRAYAFEPESQNYALLNRNIFLNEIGDIATAFPIALSDKNKVDRLYLSQFSTGGSCHQFGAETNFKLQPVKSPFAQGCVSYTLDRMIAEGALPVPNHIKIDVDGIEHLVLAGATGVLNNPELHSVLIEINTHLPQHQELLKMMADLGFMHDPQQVSVATRQTGAFQGCGNYIFWRKSEPKMFDFSKLYNLSSESVLKYVLQKVESAELITAPYPHFVMHEFFPPGFYQKLMDERLDDANFTSIGATGRTSDNYKNRFMMRLDAENIDQLSHEKQALWTTLAEVMNSQELLRALVNRYMQILTETGRISPNKSLKVAPENLMLRDLTDYSIGPHTDAPARLFSLMVYLPKDDSQRHLGTSIYVPKDPSFRCKGGPHHKFEQFNLVKTAPFVPNTALCFLKTDNSFHGVEPITGAETVRDTICYIARILGESDV